MKHAFTLICSLSIGGLFCQDTVPRAWLLKTNLASYFPNLTFYTGQANVELELPLPRKERSVAFSLGYIYSYGSTGPYEFLSIEQTRTTGFSAKGEYRAYLGRRRPIEALCLLIWPLATQLNNTREKYTGLYLSGQTVLINQWILKNEHLGEPLDQPQKLMNVIPKFLVRVGFQSISPNSVVVDQSLGIGVQYSYLTSPGLGPSPPLSTVPEGFFPTINYSLKLGWAHK